MLDSLNMCVVLVVILYSLFVTMVCWTRVGFVVLALPETLKNVLMISWLFLACNDVSSWHSWSLICSGIEQNTWLISSRKEEIISVDIRQWVKNTGYPKKPTLVKGKLDQNPIACFPSLPWPSLRPGFPCSNIQRDAKRRLHAKDIDRVPCPAGCPTSGLPVALEERWRLQKNASQTTGILVYVSFNQ